uniref:Uncharacterized protein n=1 Tax=Ananas comosus var. bracteatus TaxID=296719 RepID=A0A6V7NRY9_ANACO|nr:unnamed protein product [Ananas comosus var. bracteatus]
MIRAAIEASKRDAEGQSNQQIDVPDDITGPLLERKTPAMDDADLARAVSLSLEFAEQERALRQQEMQFGFQSSGSDKEMEDEGRSIAENGRQRSEEGNIMSVQDDTEDMEEQPLVRHRSRRVSPGNAESTESGPMVHSPPSSLPLHNIQDNRQYNGDGTPYQFSYPRQNSALHPPIPRPPSPSLTAQRLLREQQDDEYLASLLADQEKELKAKQEAERRQLEEAAARKAALEKERQEEEEARRKQLEEEEYERKLAAKEASLPQEPQSDDESAVTL